MLRMFPIDRSARPRRLRPMRKLKSAAEVARTRAINKPIQNITGEQRINKEQVPRQTLGKHIRGLDLGASSLVGTFFPRSPEYKASRYLNEALRNTLGNEEKAFNTRLQKIGRFQRKFINNYIAKNPKIAREYSMLKRSSRRPSREFNAFMREAQTRSNTAVRRKFKDDLAAMDKYQVRREKFMRSAEDKYAATDPEYKRYITNRRNRAKAGMEEYYTKRAAWEKWARQNDPSVYKRHLRDKRRYGTDPTQNRVSSSFYNRGQDSGVTESMKRWRQSQEAEGAKRIRELIIRGGVPSISPPLLQPTPKQIDYYTRSLGPRPKQPKPKVGPPIHTRHPPIKTRPQITRGEYTPSKPRRQRYNQAAYLAGLQSAPMTMGQKMNQGIAKPYANGGGVRKPKYNKKG